jgi:hypothetical protein
MPNEQDKMDDVLSDESSFYGASSPAIRRPYLTRLTYKLGDVEMKDAYDDRASEYDPVPYWMKTHQQSFSTIAYQNLHPSSTPNPKAIPKSLPTHRKCPHPHDGVESCWQLSEPISEFLERLPPSTTSADGQGPWIRVRNPHDPDPGASSRNISAFVSHGTEILRRFENDKSDLEAEHAKTKSKSTASLTRTLYGLRQQLEKDIFAAARNDGVIVGKWMLFPTVDRVDEFWASVAEATAKGELGIETKVATDAKEGGSGGTRLICIYTHDYEDKEDVRRVLLKLIDLGLLDEKGRPIYYKCDAFTYLEINSKNPYGLKASMLSSKDVINEKA